MIFSDVPEDVIYENEKSSDEVATTFEGKCLLPSGGSRAIPNNIELVVNPLYVQSIQIGRESNWHHQNETEFELMDSLLTDNLLVMTGNSSDDADIIAEDNYDDYSFPRNVPEPAENVEDLIEDLESAVMRSKGVSTLSKAVAKRDWNRKYAPHGTVAGKLHRQEILSDEIQ